MMENKLISATNPEINQCMGVAGFGFESGLSYTQLLAI